MIRVVKVKMVCFGCPSSWEGVTDDGKSVYARYRWGFLRVEVDDEVVFAEQLRDDPPPDVNYYENLHRQGMNIDTVISMWESDEVLREMCDKAGEKGFSYHGVLDFDGLKKATEGKFEWPENEDGYDS